MLSGVEGVRIMYIKATHQLRCKTRSHCTCLLYRRICTGGSVQTASCTEASVQDMYRRSVQAVCTDAVYSVQALCTEKSLYNDDATGALYRSSVQRIGSNSFCTCIYVQVLAILYRAPVQIACTKASVQRFSLLFFL